MKRAGRFALVAAAVVALVGCEPAAAPAPGLDAQTSGASAAHARSGSEMAALATRISESGGYFDTDNLISNEGGYLNVIDALAARGLRGGAYVGVGPDQNYAYIAELRPRVAIITDIRRDNTLHHLLLKALVERAPTRIEFLAGLHGVDPPRDPAEWRNRSIEEILGWIDDAVQRRLVVGDPSVHAELRARIDAFGFGLDEDDLRTIRGFHAAFERNGPGLRFTSFGRPPRPYYPTYRRLLLETDADGDPASWLSTPERYDVVRTLHLANAIVPVTGDLAGDHAIREIGAVLREMDLEITAFYTSNVEFYLWRARTFEAWRANFAQLPLATDAVVIRSYFPNFGSPHPSALPGYYATQSLQPATTLRESVFRDYFDLVTRDVLPLQPG